MDVLNLMSLQLVARPEWFLGIIVGIKCVSTSTFVEFPGNRVDLGPYLRKLFLHRLEQRSRALARNLLHRLLHYRKQRLLVVILQLTAETLLVCKLFFSPRR